MLIKIRKRWEIAEREATPEASYLNRRAMIGAAAGALAGLPGSASAQRVTDDPSMVL